MTLVNNIKQFLQMTECLFIKGISHSLRSFVPKASPWNMTSKLGLSRVKMAALRAAIFTPSFTHSLLSPRPEMLSGAKHRWERSPYIKYILYHQATRRKSRELKMTRLTKVLVEEVVSSSVAIPPLKTANPLLFGGLLSMYLSNQN